MVGNKRENHKLIAWMQIFVLVIATVAFSYLVHEGDDVENIIKSSNERDISKLALILGAIGKIIFSERGLVSAQSAISTCIETKDGELCKEFVDASQCANECDDSCIPNPASQVTECRLGTCYDQSEGTCQPNSPEAKCESDEGKWLNDINGNTLECKRGCCILGSEAQFITDQRCSIISSRLGIQKNYDSTIRNEYECLIKSQAQIEGACITGKDSFGKNTCTFTTNSQCIKARGEFHEGFLCSHSELNTNCERQKTSSCVEGKSEIYWFDSCGNRENIYESGSIGKEKSWNNGEVLSKAESCSVASGSNYLKNQRTCGNCDYLLSSRCGAKTSTERLDDPLQKNVCRSLTCVDENGKTRANGESWCVYQGAVGARISSNGQGIRAVDTPGSRHFKKLCVDGEVRTESCGDYRTEVCVEAKAPLESGKSFSNAQCVKNLGMQCLEYNTGAPEEMSKKCNDNPFCFVKHVEVGSKFIFDMCAPKVPEGYELSTGKGAACSMGTIECTAVKQKKKSGGWRWVANEQCTKAGFAEQMNDLCMSLGDCGAEVNYIGELTKNYGVSKTPGLSSNYLNEIKKYSEQDPRITTGINVENYYDAIGIPNGLGEVGDIKDPSAKLQTLGMISGGLGGVLMYAASYGAATPAVAATATTPAVAATAATTLGAVAGAAAGAAIGVSIVSLLIKITGIGPGLSKVETYALMTAGAASGAILGLQAVGVQGLGALITVAWVLAVIIVVYIAIGYILGWGKTKKIIVEFKCKPWEPPRGGKDCEKCGSDGLPCSTYACEALGQTCRFENEGTGREICIDVAPNDITPPVITPWSEALKDGLNYRDASDLGVKIRSTEGDGCIDAYSNVKFGLLLDKYGKCRYSTKPNVNYDEMQPPSEVSDEMLLGDEEIEILGNNLIDDYGHDIIRKNISTSKWIPSAAELGIATYDPSSRADYNLYIKCENANGYKSNRDYAINFCIKPGKDITAPRIEKILPSIEYVKADAVNQTLSVWTNEPADCRWDRADRDYSMMPNNFTCANEFEEQTIFGWRCSDILPISASNESTFYIRCEDKPWINDDELPEFDLSCSDAGRCSNVESKQITLRKTAPLLIDSATPDDRTLIFGVEPASVTVELKTSGGVDGTATCSYSFGGERYIDFLDTLGFIHTQNFESFLAGEKFIMLRCVDIVDNVAWKNISFEVRIDREAPQISRIFYDSGNLIIKTTENARCSISESSCEFDFSNGTLMTGYEIEHRTGVEKGKRYYVKCKDDFENMKGACDATIKVI